jgi:hypothetical protein
MSALGQKRTSAPHSTTSSVRAMSVVEMRCTNHATTLTDYSNRCPCSAMQVPCTANWFRSWVMGLYLSASILHS